MPLSFQSLSHGTIAFGFFNIESDMLLLERYFFFATDFCEIVNRLAAQAPETITALSFQIWLIENSADIGDLMGAIHGVRFSGFIGEIYKRYPFPERQKDFKQNSDGFTTQEEIAALISPLAEESVIKVVPKSDGLEISIGRYLFQRSEFQRLLNYVWLGGYPRWRGDIRPAYVKLMRDKALAASTPLLKNITFDT